jgi:hypothetical protein
MSSRHVRTLVIILVAVVCCAGLVLAAKPGGGGGCPQPRPNCVCPAIYAPVVCDGGCTYSNSCRASFAAAACGTNSTPAVAATGTPSFEAFATQASAGGVHCKKCTDRPWCGCTYNGMPRVSCNPCCYGNLGTVQVCLD